MSTEETDDGVGTVPIYFVDEFHLKPGCLNAFLAALNERYVPGAGARGQKLLQTLVTPPTFTGTGAETGTASGVVPQSVILIWELPGVAGFWGVRSQNATPEVAEWWADCEAFIHSRTRRVAADPSVISGLDALGRMNA